MITLQWCPPENCTAANGENARRPDRPQMHLNCTNDRTACTNSFRRDCFTLKELKLYLKVVSCFWYMKLASLEPCHPPDIHLHHRASNTF